MTRVPPHDLAAEEHVLGACLLVRTAIKACAPVLSASDFYRPAHGAMYQAILDLYGRGEPVDVTSVAAALKDSPTFDDLGGSAGLIRIQTGTPSTSAAGHHARELVNLAARRRLIFVAHDLAESAFTTGDPADVIDRARDALASVDLPTGKLPDDLKQLDTLLDAPVTSRSPWVVPGLLRRDWRVVVVAGEGAGKTLLLQQMAVCASQGVHPLTFDKVPPVRVLIVDLENPEDRIVQGCTPLRDNVRGVDYDTDRAWLWHRPGGIDLRTRSDAGALEAALERVRPQLVVMGPAYKASQRYKGEGWDESALAVQRVLDSLRTRFGFALLMEDHAPQGSHGSRDLRPFGSARWLAWPELGLSLRTDAKPPAPRALAVERWRGDRLPNWWPDRIEEGTKWPWMGVWSGSMPRYDEQGEAA